MVCYFVDADISCVSCAREDIGPWLGSLGAFCGKWGNDDFVRGEWVRSFVCLARFLVISKASILAV